MYIHLGGEKVIRTSELIAIFDLSSDQPNYLLADKVEKHVETIGDEQPKSFVVTKHKYYFSPISPSTLKKRAAHPGKG